MNVAMPASSIPFAACHEMAHRRGFAREDEANYIGHPACRLRPDPDFRYSGTLGAAIEAMNQLHREQVTHIIDDGHFHAGLLSRSAKPTV